MPLDINERIDALIDAATAVLDSVGGVVAMHELAEALHAVDAGRDYRDRYPDPADTEET